MKFCSECGATGLVGRSDGPSLPQHLRCEACGTRHFRNPRVVAACLAEWNGQVLLCRRAIEPGIGLWALPGGYVEASEPLQVAAAREAREEAQAIVDDLYLFRVYNLPRFNEVVAVFRGTLRDGRCAAGDETQDVALFPKRDLPWDCLALESSRAALHAYATRRWQSTYASPVEDLVWLQPPQMRPAALRPPR
jgi:ADP-ribose pyrophosphatase YjhB (NUDIX family)